MSVNKSSIVGAGSQKGGVLKPTLHDYTAITPHAVTKIPIIFDPNHHSTFNSSAEESHGGHKPKKSMQIHNLHYEHLVSKPTSGKLSSLD